MCRRDSDEKHGVPRLRPSLPRISSMRHPQVLWGTRTKKCQIDDAVTHLCNIAVDRVSEEGWLAATKHPSTFDVPDCRSRVVIGDWSTWAAAKVSDESMLRRKVEHIYPF